MFLILLRRNGNMCWSACREAARRSRAFSLIMRRRSLAGSAIGGIRETQEMLDYCAEHNIVSDIELTPIQKINEAYERMLQERREVPVRDRHGVAETGVTSDVAGRCNFAT